MSSIIILLCFLVLATGNAQDSNGGQNPIYIPMNFSIRIVNPATNQIVGAIPTNGFTINLAFSPDVKLGYAIQGDFGVNIIDLQTRQVVDSIVGPWNPSAIAVRPDGRLLAMVDNNTRSIVFVSLPDKQVLATIPVGSMPIALAFHPNGRKLYVADHDDNRVNPRVYVIDTHTFALTTSIQMPFFPADIAFTPNGEMAYVICEGSPDGSFVVAVDTEKERIDTTVPVLTGSSNISIDSDGGFGYVSTGGNSGGGILVLDLHRNMVVSTVVTGDQTFGGTVSQDGDFVYGINFNLRELVIMDTRTRLIVSSTPLGDFVSTHPATSLRRGPAIRPESCVAKHEDNRYTAYFGYENNTGAARTIPVGADNSVSPGATGQGQPEYFQTGRVRNAFHLDFDGTPIKWAVNSPSGSTYWTTASRRSAECRD
jgi:YVTN family beta-propeller protein